MSDKHIVDLPEPSGYAAPGALVALRRGIQDAAAIVRREDAQLVDVAGYPEADVGVYTADEVRRIVLADRAQRLAAQPGEPVEMPVTPTPLGWLYDWTHSSALGKPDEHFTGFTKDEAYARKHDNVRAVWGSPRPPHQPGEPSPAETRLAAAGVFKGHHGLRGLAEADDFWNDQNYGTRLYYGSGATDYLHRDVLRAAVKALDGDGAQQGEKEASGVAPAASEAEIRADERERCARACEVESEGHRMAFGQHCAAVIRGLTYGVAPCGNTPYDEGPFTLSTPADSPLHGVHASAQPDYPECSGDPANCPENEGHGCCNRIPGVEVFSALDRTLTPDNVRALVQALRNQTQIDEDGTEVGVSREAVDHAASLIERHVLGVAPATANDGSKWGNAKFGCVEGKKND